MSLVARPALNHPQQTVRRGALEAVDDRRTPRELWDKWNTEFGFVLDVAASRDNALCRLYYTAAMDGLRHPWPGRVWCNPPYSDIRPWVEKAWREHNNGDSCPVLLLPANRTEQAWWQDLIEPFRKDRGGSLEVRFIPGRLRFDVPEGTYSDPRGNRPPFGVCLVIWPWPPIV